MKRCTSRVLVTGALFALGSIFVSPLAANATDTETDTAATGSSIGDCPTNPKDRVVDVEYWINGAVPSPFRGAVHSGDEVTVKFNIDPNCTESVEVSLAAYEAPGPVFDANTASQQKLVDSDSDFFAPPAAGSTDKYSLTVTIPDCYFQVDFVQGAVLQNLGPKGSNNFYSAQNRLINASEGGTTACVEGSNEENPPPPGGTGQTPTPETGPEVEGVVLTNTPAAPAVSGTSAAVGGEVLATTGAADALPLTVVGLGLIGIGQLLRRRAATTTCAPARTR